MVDLRNALNVKKIMIERGSWRDNKIGVINAAGDGKGGLSKWRAGEVVIYRPYDDRAGECTVETPKSREYLENEGEPGSRILCIGTCVCFPLKYIDEILMDEWAAEAVRVADPAVEVCLWGASFWFGGSLVHALGCRPGENIEGASQITCPMCGKPVKYESV